MWFNGIILACHARDPGSIPGMRIFSYYWLTPKKFCRMKQLSTWDAIKLFLLVFSVMYPTLYFTKDRKGFNTPERIFVGGVSELIKTVVCFSVAYYKEKGYRKTEYFPEYVICGILSSFQSFSWIHSGQKFPSSMVQIFSYGKVFFVYVMAMLLLKRKYTLLQSAAQVLLVLGMAIPLLTELALSKTTVLREQSLVDYSVLLSLPVSSAFSGIFFEKSISKKIGSRWKNAVNYSGTSSFLSFMACAAICIVSEERVRYEKMRDILFVGVVKSFDSLLFGYIIIYYTTLMRVFATTVVSILITLLTSYQFKEEITVGKGIAMGITTFSIALFHLPYYLNPKPQKK